MHPWLPGFTLIVALTAGVATNRPAWCRASEGCFSEPLGVVFVAGGVSGLDFVGYGAQKVLPLTGISHEVRVFNWSHGKGHILQDLQDTRHLLAKSEELAAEVCAYRKAHPDRPIFLVGKSAGAGLVLAAAEQLPPCTVDRIILLSPAVSPTYNLAHALRTTRGEIVSFYSRNDRLWLGLGTTHFGTVDRVYGPAAGMRGFVQPPDLCPADAALYARLVQIDWQPGMIKGGYFGGHFGTSMPTFFALEVAPWLKAVPMRPVETRPDGR